MFRHSEIISGYTKVDLMSFIFVKMRSSLRIHVIQITPRARHFIAAESEQLELNSFTVVHTLNNVCVYQQKNIGENNG